ncbi:MAG: hypothetical protein ACLRK3_07980 [Ruminococcus sp.]
MQIAGIIFQTDYYSLRS